MNVLRCGLLALSLGTLPAAAEEWRVAAVSDRGVAFVDAASVVRSGTKVSFHLDQRFSAPLSNGRTELRERVEADCVSRKWSSKSTSVSKDRQEMSMTITTVAAPGTVYDAVITAACTGTFRSDVVADRARHAAELFAAPRPDPNKFESEAAGFSLTKPDNWTFVPLEQAKRERAELRLDDPDLQRRYDDREAFFERNAITRLVTLRKTTFAAARTVLQVSVRPLERNLPPPSPKETVEATLAEFGKAFPDLTIDSPVREFKLAGRTAAEYVATYTVPTKDDRAPRLRNRMIVAVSDQFIYFIAMASLPTDVAADEELARILSTITISK